MRKAYRGLFFVAAMIPLAHVAQASDAVDQPRVVAYGRYDGGGFILCTSGACAGALGTLQQRNSGLTDQLYLSAEDGIEKDEFCSLLKKSKPSGCNPLDPPSTPGLDANWQPNGCGTGSLSNLFIDSGLRLLMGDHYSGDFQAPYPGVSFRSACDSHDACWGVGGNRGYCDETFHQAMRNACGVVTGQTAGSTCRGFAAGYFSAVSVTDEGNTNYDSAVAARQCALYAHDLKVNGC